MKIAITFLCLVIASFIDPSTQNGYNIQLHDLPKDKVDCVVRFAYEIALKLENLKRCPESEKKARTKLLVDDMLSGLRVLTTELGCALEDILTLTNLPNDLIDSLSLNNSEEIPDALNINHVMTSVMRLLEGVLAKVGIVLKTELLKLDKLLGSLNGVLSIVSGLHDTLPGVINGLTGTLLASVLGLVSAVPDLLDSIL